MCIKILTALILSTGLTLSGYFISDGLTEARKNSRFVEVKGLAERIVKSNEAVWSINFKIVNEQLPELYKNIDESQNKVKQFLIKQGFKDNEISTNSITVTDNHRVSYNQNDVLARFAADAGLTVSTNDVDKVQDILQKTGDLVQQGIVVTTSTAMYRFSKLNTIKPAMLDEATANACEAANSFAKNAHAKLGYIRRAMQGLFSINDANSSYDSGNAIMKKVR